MPLHLEIHGKLYDISDFADIHPGGPVILTHVGRDASDVFEAFHDEATHQVLANYYVGDVPITNADDSNHAFATRMRALRGQFAAAGLLNTDPVFFATLFMINMALLAAAVALVLWYPASIAACLASCLLLAVFWQQCGWLAHDFLHHAVFANRTWNNLSGYFLGNVCQGFSVLWWKNKHNTHHAQPNVHGTDPDIDTLPFLAWSELDVLANDVAAKNNMAPTLAASPLRFLVRNQVWWYVPLLAVARLSWALQSVIYVAMATDKKSGILQRLSSSWDPGQKSAAAVASGSRGVTASIIEIPALVVHWTLYVLIMTRVETLGLALLYLCASQAFSSLLLASVFSLNHNGMAIVSDHDAARADFFTLQIETGRDVEPNLFVNWFCGGLNFQIEHHLFPTMPRHNYPKIRPLIVSLCREYGVKHHTCSFWQGTLEVISRLRSVGDLFKKIETNLGN